MASYDLKCKKCEHEFEVFTTHDKAKKKRCPECRAGTEILISACHGYVAATQDQMQTIGDLANFNRDAKTQGEKQAADKEYADSSRLATEKLRQDKEGEDRSFFGADEKKMAEIGKLSDKKQKDYIATGKL